MGNNNTNKGAWSNILSNIGQALSGFSAPFLGDNEWGQRQQQMELQKRKAQQEYVQWEEEQQFKKEQEAFKRWKDKRLINQGVPVYGIGESGLQQFGSVRKGAKIMSPASMMTPEQKQVMDVKTASMKDQSVRNAKLQGVNQAIDFFEQKIAEIPSGKGLGGRIKGAGLAIEGALQTNPNVAAYIADVEGLRSQIARGLGEVGNLSEYEQKYAVRLLPQVTDNIETRQKKLSNFRDYIQKKTNGFSDLKSGITTFNVGGKTYNIPNDKVEAFKKAKGLK